MSGSILSSWTSHGAASMQEREQNPLEKRASFDRRMALMLLGGGVGAIALTGCSARSMTRRLPEPDYPAVGEGSVPSTLDASIKPGTQGTAQFANVLPRATWTTSPPNFADMYRMAPVKYVTVHHDGMTAFTDRSQQATADRLERIRSLHRSKGWADIGYHYAIDPAGRIWACRPVTWQGAHVKNRNPGNVGIVVLGNFEEQRPNAAQLAALKVHLAQVRATFKVRSGRTFGHKDWPGAQTACPGRNLHPQVARL